jgi:hypothetical protein
MDGATDCIFVGSHVYLIVDLALGWDDFNGLSKPIHKWSFVSYSVMLSSRVICWLGTSLAQRGSSGSGFSGDFLLNARHKNGTSKFLFGLLWGVFVPFMVAWSVLGTYWLTHVLKYNSHMLSHIQSHLWMMALWQGLSYAWIAAHCRIGSVAYVLERRVRIAMDGLRQVADDDDVISRWGEVAAQVHDYTALRSSQAVEGLLPEEINALPCEEVVESIDSECAVCLVAVDLGDKARRLERCGHVFHKACIDLWLLRSSTCPLCKSSAKVPATSQSCGQVEEMDAARRNFTYGLRRRA